MRGGKEQDRDFSKRMHGEGVWADLIRQRFTKTVELLGTGGSGMLRFEQLDFSRFRRPQTVPRPANNAATLPVSSTFFDAGCPLIGPYEKLGFPMEPDGGCASIVKIPLGKLVDWVIITNGARP
jgi:hypothetical protein